VWQRKREIKGFMPESKGTAAMMVVDTIQTNIIQKNRFNNSAVCGGIHFYQ